MVLKAFTAVGAMLSGAGNADHYNTLAKAANVLWGLAQCSPDPDIRHCSDAGSEALKNCRERVKLKGLRYGLTGEEHRHVVDMLKLYDQIVTNASTLDLAAAVAAAITGREQANRAGVTRLL